jgi:hypothetical protein
MPWSHNIYASVDNNGIIKEKKVNFQDINL